MRRSGRRRRAAVLRAAPRTAPAARCLKHHQPRAPLEQQPVKLGGPAMCAAQRRCVWPLLSREPEHRYEYQHLLAMARQTSNASTLARSPSAGVRPHPPSPLGHAPPRITSSGFLTFLPSASALLPLHLHSLHVPRSSGRICCCTLALHVHPAPRCRPLLKPHLLLVVPSALPQQRTRNSC